MTRWSNSHLLQTEYVKKILAVIRLNPKNSAIFNNRVELFTSFSQLFCCVRQAQRKRLSFFFLSKPLKWFSEGSTYFNFLTLEKMRAGDDFAVRVSE
ncbi:hypothetical protein [Pseudopelagicola sp. nBUS_19]|uniref:hypothetical protein n=1 Tax=Pseudopelagicola sp. nBUS_19 TaxID=3395316 RepID=UPI003EB75887